MMVIRMLLVMVLLGYVMMDVKLRADGESVAADDGGVRELRVFQFNVWQEGSSVKGGFEMIVEAIIASEADFVALSEVRNYHGKDFHQRLIAALSKKGHVFYGEYVGGDAGLLSRYPIKKAEVVADYTKSDRGCVLAYTIELPAGREIIVCSAHLDYKNFAIYLPRGYGGNDFKMIDKDGDGKPDPVRDVEVLHRMDRASMRDDSIAAFLAFSEKHEGVDVILAGDFNECSHLDWGEDMKGLYSHNGVVIEWGNSKALTAAGFVDSYRKVFPDPVSHPGATWPSDAEGKGSTSWAPLADERDRIDFIYANERAFRVEAAFIVGSKNYYVFNKLESSKTKDPHVLEGIAWPSDHKGLIVDFLLKE